MLILHPEAFEYLKPTDRQRNRMDQLRDAYKEVQVYLNASALGGSTRYSKLASTALEESCMWAMKACTRLDNGEPITEL